MLDIHASRFSRSYRCHWDQRVDYDHIKWWRFTCTYKISGTFTRWWVSLVQINWMLSDQINILSSSKNCGVYWNKVVKYLTSLIDHVKKYHSTNYFRIPRRTQSIITFIVLTEPLQELLFKLVLVWYQYNRLNRKLPLSKSWLNLDVNTILIKLSKTRIENILTIS